jgi:RNA polymerase subunit RPABC4/transcription elongation factor Spt4
MSKKQDKYQCAECGHSIEKDANYCPGCGKEIEWGADDDTDEVYECNNCGAMIPSNAKYCPGCGKEIEWNESDELEADDSELDYDYSEDAGVQDEDDIEKAPVTDGTKSDLKKYGVVELIRANGCERRMSFTGKIVFSKYDDFPTHRKTIVLLSKGWSELTFEDKPRILRELGVIDYPEKVTWWSRTIGRVKAPKYPYEEWNWINGFTFLDSGVILHRKIDFSAKKPKLEILKGADGVIERSEIDKQNSDDHMEVVWVIIGFCAFLFIIWLIGQLAGSK